jgi:hypothetical protein
MAPTRSAAATALFLRLAVLGVLAAADASAQSRLEASRRPREAEGATRVGDPAPDFKLKGLGQKDETVVLSSFKGQKPVVLIFGSYP